MNRSHFTDTSELRGPCARAPGSQEAGRPFQFTIRRLLLFTLLLATVLGCIVNLPAMLSWAYRCWEVGKQFDQCILQNSGFAIRITAFHERGAVFAASGGFYRYEVKTGSDYWWRKIAMFRLPVPDPIPKGHFQTVTDSFGYFYHGHVFGVTTDGGTTWSIKGGDNGPIFSGHAFPYAYIEMVTIGRDGTGVMRLSDYDPTILKSLPSHNLSTIDFGQTWKKRTDTAGE
ncbi:MAG: hypothetical protein A2W31_16155 [Planctomycetes bacterium RBG_16_64_10]|nr:MAG: hypothetical protein A2W31_16155 [Planctomycetes bacterium RBG_16_64_10]